MDTDTSTLSPNDNEPAITPSADTDNSPSAGAMLRTLREQAGMELETLGAALKVSTQRLHALESDDYSALPALYFARGLAANICRHLGQDAAPVLAKMPDGPPPHADCAAQGFPHASPRHAACRHGLQFFQAVQMDHCGRRAAFTCCSCHLCHSSSVGTVHIQQTGNGANARSRSLCRAALGTDDCFRRHPLTDPSACANPQGFCRHRCPSRVHSGADHGFSSRRRKCYGLGHSFRHHPGKRPTGSGHQHLANQRHRQYLGKSQHRSRTDAL